MKDTLPLALTMGEPAGIGGEIALKTWLHRDQSRVPAFYLIDDPIRIEALAARLGLSAQIAAIDSPEKATAAYDQALPVLVHRLKSQPVPGTPLTENAPSVISAIDLAVDHVRSGRADALVTNPIHKKTLVESGFAHVGHTDYLAELAGDKTQAVMMLACAQLKVVPICVHMSLSDSINSLSFEKIIEMTQITANALIKDFGIAQPHIAITGLNPHAGEGGAIGQEEIDIIRPAIEHMKREGLSVRGPEPADTLFHERARSGYDAAICMYHDQALIPIKTLDFYGAVNVTLGLPFVRTSPDHGTAFEIAGTGVANESSLIAALRMASAMARRRRGAEGR
ncbi:MAG: 4-hydroxythreonine-4-phosphate dehydrogenase PdxA [Alphaproteobacteria bacterium]|nr:4-hydroxythreonine-4-phosphate dehydrogenase PdxA [Alphaproteobacteria bacterium]